MDCIVQFVSLLCVDWQDRPVAFIIFLRHNQGMSEADVAVKLREKNPEFLWKPISDKFGVGTPDRCVLWRGVGKVAWIELKCLGGLPKRSCKVGLKAKQAAWLEEWVGQGGVGALIVGLKDERKVAVFVSGFRDIAENGIERDRFELIKYEDVTSKLKSLLRG